MTFNLSRFLADLQSEMNALRERVERLDPSPPDRPRAGAARAATDPYASTVRFTTGVVQDTIPFYDCYRVLLEGPGGALVCSKARQTDTAATGVVDADALAPGCRVLVAVHRSEVEGFILGVLPPAVYDRRHLLNDQVSQASPNARSADPYAVDLAARPAADLCDRSGSAPLDASAVGEFSRGCAATGARLHVDPYLAFLRASEECGVYAFVQDDCLRTAGRYREDWHPGGESVVCPAGVADAVTLYAGFTPYQWEARGAARRTTPTSADVPPVESQVTLPYKAGAEPVVPDQAPLFRFVEHAGPLPTGTRAQVLAPPDAPGVHAHSAPLPQVVLADRHVGLDGRAYALTAGGHETAMRPGLVGYAPGAAAADVPAADAPPPPPTPAGNLPDGVGSALAADDLYAYRQWLAGVGFERAGWVSVGDPRREAAVRYADLAEAYTVPDPDPVERTVFEEQTVRQYPRAAGDVVLPNGTRVIFGPCGEEIRMGGGVLELSAPRIVIRSGSDVLVLAGRDLALRAHRDVDLAAANGAVRQKAETDFGLLAGNGGGGQLLLESRGDGGLTTKTDRAHVQYADSVYTRAESAVTTEVVGGGITDVALTAVRRLEAAAVDLFGPAAEPAAVNTASADGVQLSGPLTVIGRVAVTDGASFGGLVTVTGGHIFTSDADRYRGLVPQMSEESVDRLDQQNQRLTDSRDERVAAGVESYARLFTDGLAADGGPASETGMAATAFGFRPSAEVGVDGFLLYEGRWQQRARLGGQALGGWEEPPVVGPRGEPTMPYPGFEVWTSACVRTVDLVLYDVTTGAPVDTPAAYASAAYPVPVPATPTQALTVIP